jgi:hypothetical protein
MKKKGHDLLIMMMQLRLQVSYDQQPGVQDRI